jgi:hypothetical protein
MAHRKYSDQQLVEAVLGAVSIRQALGRLGLAEAGGNYATVRRRIQELNLDTSHMTGQTWNRGIVQAPSVSIEEYLNKRRPIQSFKLKHRLIREGYFERKCYSCGRRVWRSQPIPLELEHRNGNPHDNSLDNLTLLCPNCHALTTAYRGKNKKSK